jgi:hypothetical protein
MNGLEPLAEVGTSVDWPDRSCNNGEVTGTTSIILQEYFPLEVLPPKAEKECGTRSFQCL